MMEQVRPPSTVNTGNRFFAPAADDVGLVADDELVRVGETRWQTVGPGTDAGVPGGHDHPLRHRRPLGAGRERPRADRTFEVTEHDLLALVQHRSGAADRLHEPGIGRRPQAPRVDVSRQDDLVGAEQRRRQPSVTSGGTPIRLDRAQQSVRSLEVDLACGDERIGCHHGVAAQVGRRWWLGARRSRGRRRHDAQQYGEENHCGTHREQGSARTAQKTRSPTHPQRPAARHAGGMPVTNTHVRARPRRRRRPAHRPRGRDVRALRTPARHHRRGRPAHRQPAGCAACDRADHLGRAGHAAVLPRGRRRGRVRLAGWHPVGHVAVHQGPAAVQARVLVPRDVGCRSPAGEGGARGGFRGRARGRMRSAPVVPRGVSGGARVRTRADPAAFWAGGCARRRVAARDLGRGRRDSGRRRHAPFGLGQLPDRLADSRGDRRRVCAPTDRPARGTRRGRAGVRRARWCWR